MDYLAFFAAFGFCILASKLLNLLWNSCAYNRQPYACQVLTMNYGRRIVEPGGLIYWPFESIIQDVQGSRLYPFRHAFKVTVDGSVFEAKVLHCIRDEFMTAYVTQESVRRITLGELAAAEKILSVAVIEGVQSQITLGVVPPEIHVDIPTKTLQDLQYRHIYFPYFNVTCCLAPGSNKMEDAETLQRWAHKAYETRLRQRINTLTESGKASSGGTWTKEEAFQLALEYDRVQNVAKPPAATNWGVFHPV